MSSLKDKVASITKAFGLTSKGSLRQDVDKLCKATDVTFTTMKETVDALSCVCEFANEVVPKLCEDAGVDATGKLGDDVATLKTEIGVEGAPHICRQHNDDDVIEIDDEEDVKPAKKKSRRK